MNEWMFNGTNQSFRWWHCKLIVQIQARIYRMLKLFVFIHVWYHMVSVIYTTYFVNIDRNIIRCVTVIARLNMTSMHVFCLCLSFHISVFKIFTRTRERIKFDVLEGMTFSFLIRATYPRMITVSGSFSSIWSIWLTILRQVTCQHTWLTKARFQSSKHSVHIYWLSL